MMNAKWDNDDINVINRHDMLSEYKDYENKEN